VLQAKAEVASSFACASLAFERLRAKVLQAKAKVAFELQANAKRELQAKVELKAKVASLASLAFARLRAKVARLEQMFNG
jgi:hypothetical protein